MTGELTRLVDAQGHTVIASVTWSGLLTIVTQAKDGEAPGHPCLNRDVDQAVKLRDALTRYIDDGAGRHQAVNG